MSRSPPRSHQPSTSLESASKTPYHPTEDNPEPTSAKTIQKSEAKSSPVIDKVKSPVITGKLQAKQASIVIPQEPLKVDIEPELTSQPEKFPAKEASIGKERATYPVREPVKDLLIKSAQVQPVKVQEPVQEPIKEHESETLQQKEKTVKESEKKFTNQPVSEPVLGPVSKSVPHSVPKPVIDPVPQRVLKQDPHLYRSQCKNWYRLQCKRL